jgi:hypothetical protein
MFVDNAQMFMGPQFGQVPAGFQNKIVSWKLLPLKERGNS